jgi:molybdate transport system substrate-binding protein
LRRTTLLFLLMLAQPYVAAETLRVAVAANFKPTLQTISQLFTTETGYELSFSGASTGVLSSQILHGAPFDLLFAADRASTELIAESGIGQQPFCYALGQLSLAGGDAGLAALTDPTLSLAIANPAAAPYGRAATQVLARPEFREAAKRKLVRGNNAVQAYQFWHSGSVNLALIPRSLAPADATDIPPQWHSPLEQYAIVLRPSAGIDSYLQWLERPKVQQQLAAAGYLPCP